MKLISSFVQNDVFDIDQITADDKEKVVQEDLGNETNRRYPARYTRDVEKPTAELCID